MNDEELTMLAQEDGREEISASELMRPAAQGMAGEEGGVPGGDVPGGDVPGDGELSDGESGGDEPDDAEADGGQDEAQAAIGRYRETLARLMGDGWTMEELRAMCADGEVHRALERGETLGRAATAYLRRGAQAGRPAKRGVPTFRAPATEDTREDDPIARMSDAEFAAFSRRAKEAALAGKRIRLG